MRDIFKTYTGVSFGKDPLAIAKKVLTHPDDKGMQELFCFFLVVNSRGIDGRKIYENLNRGIRSFFVDIYNRAYLLLRVWSRLVAFTTKREHFLPNLFLPRKAEVNPFYFYKQIFGKDSRRLERRWKEILNFC